MQAFRGKLTVLCLTAIMAITFVGAAHAEKLILGVAGAHTGDLAPFGLPTVNAAKIVAKNFNAKGGVLGMEVEVMPQDDQCKPEQATNAATKLVSEKAPVVIGHICSGATKAALPIYKDAKIVLMSPSATATALTKSGDYPNFFRTISFDDFQGKISAEFTMNKLGAKKIAVLHDKGEYGMGYANVAKDVVEKSGKAEVVLFEGVTPGAVDYSAVVQKVKESGADALIFGGYHPEASKIVMSMRKKKVKIPFVSDDGVNGADIIKIAGPDAEGIYATGPEDYSSNPAYKKAVEEHKKEFGTEPGMFYAQAYAAAEALLTAIQNAGKVDYDAIVEALHTKPVSTTVGTIKFDKNGDAEGVGFSVYVVKNGKWEVVK